MLVELQTDPFVTRQVIARTKQSRGFDELDELPRQKMLVGALIWPIELLDRWEDTLYKVKLVCLQWDARSNGGDSYRRALRKQQADQLHQLQMPLISGSNGFRDLWTRSRRGIWEPQADWPKDKLSWCLFH